ncbi:MAG: hypothetical protein DMF73_18065, partial [Acidobacteria bacterium]
DALRAIEQTENFGPSKTTGQLRYEGKSPLVVMWEVPPASQRSEMKPRYVIGNGEDIRFILREFSDVRDFRDKLRSAFR